MSDGSEILYIGCYTDESGGLGDGIVALRRDPVSGAVSVAGTVADTPSPSFLARHPAKPVLYAVNELDDGAVSAWAVAPDASLRPLITRSTGGAAPCHLAVTADGGHLVVANYGGSLAVFPLDSAGIPQERSDLVTPEIERDAGERPTPADRGASERQRGPHVHMVSPGREGEPLLAVDLGTDSVYRYDIEPATGRLLPHRPWLRTSPGAGPRHLARHPDGRRCYVVGELDATVTGYDLAAAGGPQGRWRVATSQREGHVQPSEVAVPPDGRFLYVANRGVDTIAVFALTDDHAPTYVTEVDTEGDWPRHFALIGPHLYVANERSHTVASFAVDPVTGVPAPSGQPAHVPSPTCIISAA
ncbi:MAG TPA: lactonase family protein [Micromonosporaceae bacterium]|nr:lactonase family protein [Micromonosporaceae bacterium]